MAQTQAVQLPPQVRAVLAKVLKIVVRELGQLVLALVRNWLDKQFGDEGEKDEAQEEGEEEAAPLAPSPEGEGATAEDGSSPPAPRPLTPAPLPGGEGERRGQSSPPAPSPEGEGEAEEVEASAPSGAQEEEPEASAAEPVTRKPAAPGAEGRLSDLDDESVMRRPGEEPPEAGERAPVGGEVGASETPGEPAPSSPTSDTPAGRPAAEATPLSPTPTACRPCPYSEAALEIIARRETHAAIEELVETGKLVDMRELEAFCKRTKREELSTPLF